MDQSHGLGNWTQSNEDLFLGNFPIHRACRDGDIDCLVSLLSAGDANFYEEDDFYGWSPVHWASYFGKLPCLMRLLDCGASCDAATERINQTPAHIAAYGGQSHCLKWLLHCGATLSRQLACLRRLVSIETGGVGCDISSSTFSQTPVHLSAYAGHPQCLQWLLQSNCNFNSQDYLGETPCHKAARTGSMECISLLVSQGAKLDIRNQSGNTAAQVAASSGFTECANYLERAMQIQVQAAGVYDEMRTPVTHPTTCLSNPMSNPIVSERSSPPNVFQSSSGENVLISVNRYHSNPHYISSGAERWSANHSMANGLNHNNNNQSEDCDMEMEEGAQGGHDYLNSNGAMDGATNGDMMFSPGVWRNGVQVAGKKRGLEGGEEECFKRARSEDFSRKISSSSLNEQQSFCNGFHHDKDVNENIEPHTIQADSSDIEATLERDMPLVFKPLHTSSLSDESEYPSLPVSSSSPYQEHQKPSTPKHKLNGWLHNNGHLANHMMPPITESMVEHYKSVSIQQCYDNMVLDSVYSDGHRSNNV